MPSRPNSKPGADPPKVTAANAVENAVEGDFPLVLRLAYAGIFLLLAAVTVGVGYLTFVDWRDRRRQNEAERKARRPKR